MAVFRIDRLSASPLSATPTRERLAALLKRRGGKRAPTAQTIRMIEFALVVAIGALLAWTFWNGLGPVDAPPAAAPARAAPADAAAAGPVNPFRTAAVAEAPPSTEPSANFAETTLDLKLHGTWIDDEGGIAIIGTPDGKQARFAPGETISGGVTLDRVYRQQVVIVRNGVRESLSLINRDGATGGIAAAPPPAARAIEGDAGMAQIGELVLATPETDEVGNMRLVLQPTDDVEAFEALGLRAGDTLVAVDNQAVGRDIASSLETIAALDGEPSVTLSVERDGIVMPVTVALPQDDVIPQNQDDDIPQNEEF